MAAAAWFTIFATVTEAGILNDIKGDGKIDVSEAIYGLQVAKSAA